jgi:hypothetical protein
MTAFEQRSERKSGDDLKMDTESGMRRPSPGLDESGGTTDRLSVLFPYFTR